LNNNIGPSNNYKIAKLIIKSCYEIIEKKSQIFFFIILFLSFSKDVFSVLKTADAYGKEKI